MNITCGIYFLCLHSQQGGNSNLDCVPRTVVSDGGGGGVFSSNFVHQMCHQGGRGVLSSNFVHQMCHQGGGRGVLSSNFVHQMCYQGGRGGSLVPTLSTRCATRGGRGVPPLPPPHLVKGSIVRKKFLMHFLGFP